MAVVHQVYSVPAVFNNYSAPTTLVQALDALELLNVTIAASFDKITQSVREHKSKIHKINNRIKVVQAKVDSIKGATTATTVFATAKYPKDDHTDYTPVYKGMDYAAEPEPLEDDDPDAFYQIDVEEHDKIGPSELFQLHSYINPDLSVKNDATEPGLGPLPEKIPSISAMLLFNSTQTPYKEYNTDINTLLGEDREAREQRDAAASIAEGLTGAFKSEELAENEEDNPEFRPQLRDFAAPAWAAQLPGLNAATNVVFRPSDQTDSGGGIAPSLRNAGMVLPMLMDTPGSTPAPPPAFAPAAPSYGSAPPPPPAGGAPPPPPPGPGAPPPPPGPGFGAPPPPGPPGPPPPGPPPPGPPPPPAPGGPPPPPPAGGPPPPPPAAGGAPPPPPSGGGGGGGGGRGDLLSAIRNAGGSNKKKHLKSKKRKVKQKPKIKRKPTMAEELAARLNRRAVGMRGGGSKKKGKKAKAKSKKKKVVEESSEESSSEDNDPMADLAGNDSDTSENSSSEDWD